LFKEIDQFLACHSRMRLKNCVNLAEHALARLRFNWPCASRTSRSLNLAGILSVSSTWSAAYFRTSTPLTFTERE
jgi:hypothetical protein